MPVYNFTTKHLTYFCKWKQHQNISTGADGGIEGH